MYLDQRQPDGGGFDLSLESAAYPLDELMRDHEYKYVRIFRSFHHIRNRNLERINVEVTES